ncbi:calcium-independent phospholipase A2-gamma [Fusarium tjaetaba]|uniref:Calcium-independent phospholipase A2-gamma n=1 Tax=Fusarium tjaetaba TaxID=1567544 RepID=A0A8H5SCG4_9HYPO|nr:calcium-independent phospholipase A2-gamma [Fusarium tjaetaba]KAF5648464.1 calcium-independent phospholipase A2-gamma [Fusarium tjaetaba]
MASSPPETSHGGGVRGYRNHDEPAYKSSYYPWMGNRDQNANEDNPESERVGEYLPCHYFDYVAGTSTGSLSSIILGRLRMSVDEALDTYKAFGNAVCGKPRWFHERSFLWYPRAKFSYRKTQAVFQEVVYQTLRRDSLRQNSPERVCFPSEAETEPLKYREDRTRTIAISWAINKEGGVSKEFVWRSYDNDFSPKAHDSNLWNPSNAGPAHTTAIWEVARATTAAPRYFESIKIIGRKFLDGGMVANNPSLIVIREIHNLHGLVPALFVSIGTGLKASKDAQRNGAPRETNGEIRSLRRAATRDDVRRKQFLKKYIEIGKEWKNWMVDCEGMNGTNGWRGHCRAIKFTEHLYRLNVEGDLHTIPLDDWRPSNTGEETLKFIEEQTRRYLAGPRVSEYINCIAKKAVEVRRQRAATEQWERFAVDVVYRCPDCDNKKYDTRAKLREHLQKGTEHRRNRMADGKELEEKLNASRTFRPDRPVETGR